MPSEFEELNAQLNGTLPGPAPSFGYSELEAQMPPSQPDPTPVADDLSLLDRYGKSYDNRVMSMADTFENQSDSTFLQQTAQVGGDTAGLVFDLAADTLVEVGQEGVSMLPQEVQGYTKEQFGELVNSPVGQQAISAWQQGEAAWDMFANKFPAEARTLSKGLDLFAMGKPWQKIKLPADYVPLRINKTGMRKELSPPAGRDRDVYNVITPERSKAERAQQIKQGNVTNPTGPLRSQKVVPTEQEWKVVDEVKKLNVGPQHTMVTNANTISGKIDELADKTIKMSRRAKGGVDTDLVLQNIDSKLEAVRTKMPAVFGADASKGAKTIDDIVAQFQGFLDQNGNSYEGLLVSRQQLDHLLNEELKLGTYGTGRKASAVTEAHKAIRTAVNDIVKDGVPGTGELLNRQHLLFDALDATAVKGASEASTSIGRLLQTVNMHNPTTPLAQITTLAHPLVWAGAIATAPVTLANYGYQHIRRAPMVTNKVGAISYGLRDVIREGKKVLAMTTDKEVRKQINYDIKILASLLHTLPRGEEEEAK